MSDHTNSVTICKSLTSAFKLFYLGVFILTAWYFFNPFWSHLPSIFNSLGAGDIPFLDGVFILFVLFLLPLAVFMHFLRLYITMELLEDPTSPFHAKFIRPLTSFPRYFEQLVRLIVIAIITFKALGILGFGMFDSLQHLCSYMLLFYGLLMFWDVMILTFHFRNKTISWKDTYILQNIVSFMASAIAWLISRGQLESYFLLALALLFIIAATVYSFIKDYKYGKNNEFVNRSFIPELLKTIKSIFIPYYGEEKSIEEARS